MTGRDGLLLLLCFLLGSVPFAYLITRLRGVGDIRTLGSGNVGATNVLRTQGKVWGLVTLALDFGKAALAVWLCRRFGSAPWLDAAGGACAVLGHCFPPWLRFRGGKGVASGLGAFTFIAPIPTLIALGVFMLEVMTLRFISLGSILAAVAFAVSIAAFHFYSGLYTPPHVLIAVLLCLLLIQRHHANIGRLLAGTEKRIWGQKKEAEP